MDNVASIATIFGGGFFGGILMGWALKKVVKIFAIMAGLFLVGLAYLQYQQIATINWDKIERTSGGAINAVVNATEMINGSDHPEMAGLAITNFGIPITGSMSAGFTIGFMKR
jgi:uncharacterized membrane protein (Fun14 family)